MGSIKNLRVIVFGAGSIGCYLGGNLQAVGANVAYVGRERVKWEMDMKGLRLTHYKRADIHISREMIDYHTNPDVLAEADIILVCVKSQDTEAAASAIINHGRDDALIVSFQNGVSNAQTLQKISGRGTLAGIVPFNVTPVQRGEFHSGTEGQLIIEASDDKRFSSALSGDTLRAGLSQKSYRRVLSDMMEEGLGVCRRAGIEPKTFGKASIEKTISILRLSNFLFRPVMNSILKIDETARSSMLDDLEAGKQPEIDYLQGEIVRLARDTYQSAPINTIILELVHEAFEKGVSPFMSGDDIIEKVDNVASRRGLL